MGTEEQDGAHRKATSIGLAGPAGLVASLQVAELGLCRGTRGKASEVMHRRKGWAAAVGGSGLGEGERVLASAVSQRHALQGTLINWGGSRRKIRVQKA